MRKLLAILLSAVLLCTFMRIGASAAASEPATESPPLLAQSIIQQPGMMYAQDSMPVWFAIPYALVLITLFIIGLPIALALLPITLPLYGLKALANYISVRRTGIPFI